MKSHLKSGVLYVLMGLVLVLASAAFVVASRPTTFKPGEYVSLKYHGAIYCGRIIEFRMEDQTMMAKVHLVANDGEFFVAVDHLKKLPE